MNNLLEYKGYHAKVDVDVNDKIFIGTVIGINDVLAFHGNSYSELENVFHQSIDNYLEMCAFFGKKPEKEYKGSFNVRLSPELHKKADIAAKSSKMTLNQYVCNAIEQALDLTVKNEKIVFCLLYETRRKSVNLPIDTEKYSVSERVNWKFNKEVVLN